MRKINFTKMVASGNDFVVCEIKPSGQSLSSLARSICARKFGIGADGLLLLEKSRFADARMRIFNADGSQAEMCGNGARCVGLYLGRKESRIETRAGIITAQLRGNEVKIKLTDPKGIKLDIPLKINRRSLKVNFINTGVPHVVIFVESLDKLSVPILGRKIRFHKRFSPQGTNVDFVELLGRDSIKIRTYERGVEDETLACGTGSVAAAIVSSCRLSPFREGNYQVNVLTRSKEVLKVYFTRNKSVLTDVWMEGKAEKVCQGEYYVK